MEDYQKQWEFLKKKFEMGQLGHAYLLSGPAEADKFHFAKEFIRLINCLSSQILLCEGKTWEDKCQNCKMIEKENFPDLLIIKSKNSQSSLKEGKDNIEIDVSQIRNAQNFLSYKSYYGGFKAVIIEDAERMNFEAQNCFLKSLEEPKGDTIIFLISSKPNLLLNTILSRCQEIKFFYNGKYEISNDEKIILSGLEKIINSKLAEKFQYAKSANLEGENFGKILMVLRKYFRNLLISQVENSQSAGYSIEKLRKILELIEHISHQSQLYNINNKMALEVILLET